MSFIINNNKEDIIYFKEEILKDIKQFETKLKQRLDSHVLSTQTKLDDNQAKITTMIEKVNSLSNKVSTNISLKEKVEEIYEFKLKAQQDFMVNEVNREAIAHDLKTAINKYDNILSNSVLYPGVIGVSCKFPNLHDFIDYTLSNISQLNTAKEKNDVEFKNFRKKTDTSIKNLNTQVESNSKEMKSKFKNVYAVYDEKLKKMEEDNLKSFVDVKIDNNKYVADLKDTGDKLVESYKNMEILKSELEEKFQIEVNKVIHLPEEFNKKLGSVRKEMDNIKMKFLELTDFVKSYKFVLKKPEKSEKSEKIEVEKAEKKEKIERTERTEKIDAQEEIAEESKEVDKKILTAKKEIKKKDGPKIFKAIVSQGVSVLKQYISGEISYDEYKRRLKMKNNHYKEETKISPNKSQNLKKSVMNAANVAEIFVKDNNRSVDLNINYDEHINRSSNIINIDSKIIDSKNEINTQKRNSNEKELNNNEENFLGMIKMYNMSKKKEINISDLRNKENEMSFQEQDQYVDKSNEILDNDFIIQRIKTDSLFQQKLSDINEDSKNKNNENRNNDSFILEEKHYFPDINNLGSGLIKIVNYNTKKVKEKRERKKSDLLEFIKKSYDDQEINDEKALMQLKNAIAYSKNINNNKANNSSNNSNDLLSNTLSISFKRNNIKNVFKKELNLKKIVFNRHTQNSFIESLKGNRNSSSSLISLEKINLNNIFIKKPDMDNMKSNYKKLIPIHLKESRSTSNIRKRKINEYSLINQEDKNFGKIVNKIKDMIPYEDKISFFETSNIENLNKNVFSVKNIFYKK